MTGGLAGEDVELVVFVDVVEVVAVLAVAGGVAGGAGVSVFVDSVVVVVDEAVLASARYQDSGSMTNKRMTITPRIQPKARTISVPPKLLKPRKLARLKISKFISLPP